MVLTQRSTDALESYEIWYAGEALRDSFEWDGEDIDALWDFVEETGGEFPAVVHTRKIGDGHPVEAFELYWGLRFDEN